MGEDGLVFGLSPRLGDEGPAAAGVGVEGGWEVGSVVCEGGEIDLVVGRVESLVDLGDRQYAEWRDKRVQPPGY